MRAGDLTRVKEMSECGAVKPSLSSLSILHIADAFVSSIGGKVTLVLPYNACLEGFLKTDLAKGSG